MAKAKDKKGSIAIVANQAESNLHISEEPTDVKHIRIALKGYMNITPRFSICDLTIQAKFMEKDLGTSSKTHVIDDDFIPTHDEFFIECDINSSKDLDRLISNPILCISVFESVGEIDKELLAKLGTVPKSIAHDILLPLSADSAADLSDAFTGKTMDRSACITSEERPSQKDATKSKSDTSKKDKKDSKTEKIGDVKEKPSEMDFPREPVLMGTATLDLVPLFQGHTEIKETILVHQTYKYSDDRIVPTNIMPRLIIEVDILDEFWLPQNPNSNIFSLTVESIYNIPSIMSQDMQYKVSTFLPTVFSKWNYAVVEGGKFKTKVKMEKVKRWPGMLTDSSFTGATKYRIDDDLQAIKNNIEVNLDVLNSEEPRIEWNIIKRTYMTDEAVRELLKKLKKHRHLALEIYVTSAQDTSSDVSPQKANGKGKDKSDASNKSDKGKKGKEAEKGGKKEMENYLHLMAIVDVSTLLYPGVNKCRIACSLNTYQELEILQQTGQENSYFVPKQELPPSSPGKDDKKGGKSDKESVKSKPKSKESDKGSKKVEKGDANKNDLKPMLPPPPPPLPEPSTPVYNEKGQRTFILIEIELQKPLSPQRELHDLSQKLTELLPRKPEIPKIVISSHLANLYFKDVITQLTMDIIHQHQHYIKKKQYCKCERESGDSQTAFITFLQRTGVYHTYLTTITKAASVIVNDKFPYKGEFERNSKDYQNFIAEVYCSLITQTNSVLNELTSSGAENTLKIPLVDADCLLLYAKEATAIGATILADRYYLERICRGTKDGNAWFDYAVFQLEIGDKEKSLECLKQCLLVNDQHYYSLLLCGILLAGKHQIEEAETCFLTAVLHKQSRVEGWATMHLFYSQIGNKEGSDLCLQMANKFLNKNSENDYFNSQDDLAWVTTICPNTVFFQTAMLLLKMRAFDYAEKALAHEFIKKPGICHYYLAVIMFYRRNHQHALIHLKQAEKLHGLDYAVTSLKGHCFLALTNLEKAKEHYLYVLESYDRPDDIHLVYIYLAVVWDRLGDKQSARKLLLLACKFSPTPYSWLTAGILYYGQQDLLSAEQCLTQANLCDNRLPEIWGYLALINLELHRLSEAELCYNQAKKHKMRDENLEKKIHEAMILHLQRKENNTIME